MFWGKVYSVLNQCFINYASIVVLNSLTLILSISLGITCIYVVLQIYYVVSNFLFAFCYSLISNKSLNETNYTFEAMHSDSSIGLSIAAIPMEPIKPDW